MFRIVVSAAVLALGIESAAAAASDEHHHASPAPADGRTIAIAMDDMSFSPAAVQVHVGETIRFVLTNRSTIAHDFTLGDKATQEAHRRAMAEATGHGHHADANAVMVEPGETKTLAWVFDRPGAMEYDCNIPGHFESGMTGMVTVTP